MWAFLSRNRDAGILVLRVLLGSVFIWLHGWDKLADGVDGWAKLGRSMGHFGIHFWPKFWGFLCAMAETVGVFLVILGLAFRPACLVVTLNLIVASVVAFYSAKTFSGGMREASHAMELAIVFFSLIFIGPGKYSVDKN